MNTKYYTKSGMHPDDAINEVKNFINELQSIQELYFNKLVKDLNANKDLEEFLFDYVFNEEKNIDLMFTEYLHGFDKNYNDFVNE
jgi:hypothetical protein